VLFRFVEHLAENSPEGNKRKIIGKKVSPIQNEGTRKGKKQSQHITVI
jgi:hypothetical protein